MSDRDHVEKISKSLMNILLHTTDVKFRKTSFDFFNVTNSTDFEVAIRNRMLTMLDIPPDPVPPKLEEMYFANSKRLKTENQHRLKSQNPSRSKSNSTPGTSSGNNSASTSSASTSSASTSLASGSVNK